MIAYMNICKSSYSIDIGTALFCVTENWHIGAYLTPVLAICEVVCEYCMYILLLSPALVSAAILPSVQPLDVLVIFITCSVAFILVFRSEVSKVEERVPDFFLNLNLEKLFTNESIITYILIF